MTAFIYGPDGQMQELIGPIGETPPCPGAKFRTNQVVRIRRLKHLKHLPEVGAIVAVVPPDFSPDWALDDFHRRPRKLLHQVGSKAITYLVAFENNPRPYLFKEAALLPSNLPDAEIQAAP